MEKVKYGIILDTNVLLVSISSRSMFHWIFQSLISGDYDIFFTNEILTEYDEVISQRWNKEVAQLICRTLIELPNAHFVTPYFKLNLITSDPDDNKFVDCCFAANAHYIVTEDKHFNDLKKLDFPQIKTLKIQDFEALLKGQ